MWCIGRLTEEYRARMYHLLDLYGRPYDADEPVICMDEKSKQLLAHARPPLAIRSDGIRKEDYEYRRRGTRNIFLAVEPKAGQRQACVTHRRTKRDFVDFVSWLANTVYAGARKLHLVVDNLNTHFRASFEEILGMPAADMLLQRVELHYTPKHASWLNMAEIEIGIMDRQCTKQRFATEIDLCCGVAAWQTRRNTATARIDWKFTRQDADKKLSHHYVL